MQTYTSKMTSVNSTKLPRIYNLLKWDKLHQLNKGYRITLLDYGCGRYTNHIKDFIGDQYIYTGYDPNWNPKLIEDKYFDIIICSNVFNVINSVTEIKRIHEWIRNHGMYYFITIYEGDGSCVGRESKKDCWQRHEPTGDYMWEDEVMKKKVITNLNGINYII